MNTPYKKEGGIEIKKDQPYLSPYPNRKARRVVKNLNRLFNNKKGPQVVVTNIGRGKFSKVRKDFQRFKGKTLVQYKLS